MQNRPDSASTVGWRRLRGTGDRCVLLRGRTRAGESVAHARQAYANRPTIYAADALGWALCQSGHADKAKRWADSGLKLNTQDALHWFRAGMIDARLGSRAAAREKLAYALQLNPYFSLL